MSLLNMDFCIYNTLTRGKEAFKPVAAGKAGIYTCGPTVYNFAHIGNLRTYIFEDILIKALQYFGYRLRHVMNVTDVGHLESDSDTGEDKMAKGSERERKSVWEIARLYEDAFFEDCRQLNIRKPDDVCRATEHIDDMIDFIKTLEEKGYTYIANGNVYFSIDKFPGYSRLANMTLEELQAGSRVDIDPFKKNPLDFVLWFTNSKFKNQIMQWDSPWGTGFPGWHIECSAMSVKYLGEYIDIHCGGVDHIPVHHTNEIAQSEAAVGHQWVNYWVHGEFLVLDGIKMSKSAGDFLTLKRLTEEGFTPLDFRFLCLQSRYRKQLLFNFEIMKDAKTAFRRLRNRIQTIGESIQGTDTVRPEKLADYKKLFAGHIGDDLNTPNAITVLWDAIKDEDLSNKEKALLIEDFDSVLSLDLLIGDEKPSSDVDEALINKLIEERNRFRQEKNWAEADRVRGQLSNMGIVITDSKEGTTWQIR